MHGNKTRTGGWPLAATLFAFLACAACTPPDDQELIHGLIARSVAALEDRKVDDAAEALSPAYRDAAGRDARTLRQMAFLALQQGPVHVFLRDERIVVEGDAATVTVTAYVLQTSGKFEKLADAIPKDADRLELTIRLARESGDWKVVAIDGV